MSIAGCGMPVQQPEILTPGMEIFMATESTATGNLLAKPELKTIKVKGEDRTICEMRIMSDVWLQDADGNPIQDADKSHPVQITVWNERLAKLCAHLLDKGMRVVVTGQSFPHIYRVSDADRSQGKNDFFETRMDASNVCLALNRIQEVVMQPRRSPEGA